MNLMHLVHGENPSRQDLILINGGGVALAILLTVILLLNGASLSLIQWVVLLGLALDIGGGVVANVAQATNAYYTARPFRLSLIFLLVHVAQPALTVLFLGAEVGWAVTLYGIALLGGLVVALQRGQPSQRPLAAFILMIGLVVMIYGFPVPIWLAWIAPLYLFKLVYAFAVQHTAA